MSQRKYSPNQRIGEWTLLTYEPEISVNKKREQRARWKCVCSCGAVRLVAVDNLSNGSSRSCGHKSGRKDRNKKNVRLISSVFDLGKEEK